MDAYISGDWKVKAGMEDEFVSRWLAFTGWALENAAGATSFVLLRDDETPGHFVSFGTWADRASVDAWRSGPEFRSRIAACIEVCDQFYGADYSVAAAPALAR